MGKRLGRYEIIRTLARGSLTDLLLGRATGEAGFQRHVAIKQLREEHAEDAACLEMFVNEARLAAALHHHNIVQVTDIGEENSQPFFAMEYVHGVDLRALLTHLGRRQEQLPLQHVVSIIASAAAALHHAHDQRGPDGAPLGIVHRQVTPANLLVGFDGNVKVVDFGIAKAAIKRIQTGVGVLKGSAPYMAPEQCAGRTIDRRSDVFALGIVLYELATVRRLFKGANEFLTMSAVVNAEVPRPSQYRRDVPPDLEIVMLKALARDPLARYQTAADMANALDSVARSVGVGASTSGLANYLRQQFGERKEPWLQTPAVEVDPEPTEIDFDGGASGLAPPSSEAVKSNAIPKMIAATKSSPIAQARTVVVTPQGRAKSPSTAPAMPMDRSFSVATSVDDPEPAFSRHSTEVGDDLIEELEVPPPPTVVERPSGRNVNASYKTVVVEPLVEIVARAPTVTQPRSRKLLYIGAGGAVLATIILAIVLWPAPDLAGGNSAAPVAESEPPRAAPEQADEPAHKPAMVADAGVIERVAEADAAVETPEVAEVDPPVETPEVAEIDPPADVKPADVKPADVKPADVKPAAKPAAKTPKRTTTKKAPVKRTTKKPTTKKTTKPKWDPDDLFLGE